MQGAHHGLVLLLLLLLLLLVLLLLLIGVQICKLPLLPASILATAQGSPVAVDPSKVFRLLLPSLLLLLHD